MSAAPDVAGRVRAGGTLVPDAPLVVATSGGRDSRCLLDVAVAVVGAPAVLAVHVHHALRGRDADRDAAAAVEAARSLGAAARCVVLAPPAGAGATWAREARGSALRRVADGWGGPGTPVALAHTAGDQAETVLLRLASSPGARSLAGIRPVDRARGLVRPLLDAGITRDEVAAWCAARGLAWRDDPSNPSSPRGRVRSVLAALAAVDARAPAALVATAALAREDDDALTGAAARLLDAAGRPAAGGPGRALDAAALAGAPRAVARRALRLLAEEALGGDRPRAAARLDDVLALGSGHAPDGRALDVGDGVRIVVGPAGVRCEASPRR